MLFYRSFASLTGSPPTGIVVFDGYRMTWPELCERRGGDVGPR